MRSIHCTATIMGSEHKDQDKAFSRSKPQTRVPLPPAVRTGAMPDPSIHQKGQPLLPPKLSIAPENSKFFMSFFNSNRLGIKLSRICERTIVCMGCHWRIRERKKCVTTSYSRGLKNYLEKD